jgi:rare lipoprotein A
MNAIRIVFIVSSFLLASCGASAPRFTNENNTGEGRVSTPEGKIYHPDKNIESYEDAVPLDFFTGIASYYADKYDGKRTSNGEVYDMNGLTAANKDLPFDTIVRVINLENQKSVILRINDRGPLKKGRILDVSLEAAKRLEMIGKGSVKVQVEVLKYGENAK